MDTTALKLKDQTFIDPSMISSALEYWFTTNDHVRSPFPERIQKQLAEEATAAMLKWAEHLSGRAQSEFNDEMKAECFEELLFEIAHEMVTDEDEKITIKYPFMPRVGDNLTQRDNLNSSGADGVIVARRIEKRGDHSFLIVDHKEEGSGKISTNEFELPE